MSKIILFDGVCNLCDTSVQWIIRNDSAGKFKFAPLQAPVAMEMLRTAEMAGEFDPTDPESFVLVEDGQLFFKSDAWFRIIRELDFPASLLRIFALFPRFIRDYVYVVIGRNRYKMFGKKEFCMIPTPEIRERFIDIA